MSQGSRNMRRGRGPTISLFSFQDIITSVMGILIFVALILALRLVQTTATITEELAAKPDLEEIRRLEERIAELKEQYRHAVEEVERYSSISLADVETLRREVATQTQQLREIEERVEQEARHANEHTRTRSAEILAMKRRVEELNQKLASLNADLKRIGAMKELTFTVTGFESSNRYVLDLRKDVWQVSRLSPTGEATPIGSWTGSVKERERQALSWCYRRSGNDYVLVLIRPSMIEGGEKIIEYLRRANIPRGFEPLGEDQEFHLVSGQ